MYQQDINLNRFVTSYHRLPEKVRLVLTAILGATIGWITYEVLYWLNPLTTYRATTSWGLSFLVGVAMQHGLHRWLTFTHQSPYLRSLGRAYLFYSGSALLGALTNYYLTVILGVHHRLAWLVCLGFTALSGVFFLKRFVFVGEHASPTRGRME